MMDGSPHNEMLAISGAALGRLMPMHLWIARQGHIRAAGPTMEKLIGAAALGRRFLDLFEVRRPERVCSMADLARLSGQRLHLRLRHPPRTRLRGLVVPLGEGEGHLVNLSFGIAATEAVREHALTDADFAPTDLTVELLYLTEVKAAVMEELKALNGRLRAAHQAAEERAQTDALTGLANRRAFGEALERALEQHRRRGRSFALLHLDLDYFKTVNDTLGHAAGDLVLGRVGEILRQAARKGDTVARIGGDEFVLILNDMADEADVQQVARRLIEELERPVDYAGRPCRISGSVGATLSRFYDDPDADRMLSDADAALYASKRAGRGCCTLHRPPPAPPAAAPAAGPG
ncbi:diguanylate cyclase domain-containing protein [Albidovulum sp.]